MKKFQIISFLQNTVFLFVLITGINFYSFPAYSMPPKEDLGKSSLTLFGGKKHSESELGLGQGKKAPYLQRGEPVVKPPIKIKEDQDKSQRLSVSSSKLVKKETPADLAELESSNLSADQRTPSPNLVKQGEKTRQVASGHALQARFFHALKSFQNLPLKPPGLVKLEAPFFSELRRIKRDVRAHASSDSYDFGSTKEINVDYTPEVFNSEKNLGEIFKDELSYNQVLGDKWDIQNLETKVKNWGGLLKKTLSPGLELKEKKQKLLESTGLDLDSESLVKQARKALKELGVKVPQFMRKEPDPLGINRGIPSDFLKIGKTSLKQFFKNLNFSGPNIDRIEKEFINLMQKIYGFLEKEQLKNDTTKLSHFFLTRNDQYLATPSIESKTAVIKVALRDATKECNKVVEEIEKATQKSKSFTDELVLSELKQKKIYWNNRVKELHVLTAIAESVRMSSKLVSEKGYELVEWYNYDQDQVFLNEVDLMAGSQILAYCSPGQSGPSGIFQIFLDKLFNNIVFTYLQRFTELMEFFKDSPIFTDLFQQNLE